MCSHVHGRTPTFQYWMMSKDGEIRRDDTCMDLADGTQIKLFPCHGMKGHQFFEYRDVSRTTVYELVTVKSAYKEIIGTIKMCSL